MADDITLPTTGSGTATPIVATDEVSTKHYQRIKISNGEADSAVHLGIYAEDEASADGDTGILLLAKRADTPASSSGTDGDYEPLQVSGGKQWVKPIGDFTTVTVDVTRAANTTTYAVNDNFGSTPSGGYTITNALRVSAGSAYITDIYFSFEEDAAVPMFGELKIFDSSTAEVADNAAWVVSDAEAKTTVAEVPFVLTDNGNQGVCHVQGLMIGFTGVGSANLRFSVKVKNAYIPTTNSSVLSCRFKIQQIN